MGLLAPDDADCTPTVLVSQTWPLNYVGTMVLSEICNWVPYRVLKIIVLVKKSFMMFRGVIPSYHVQDLEIYRLRFWVIISNLKVLICFYQEPFVDDSFPPSKKSLYYNQKEPTLEAEPSRYYDPHSVADPECLSRIQIFVRPPVHGSRIRKQQQRDGWN